ncbi:MAG TPA: SHOCT domain-containing protein [Acidimicrobiia bacterium]
MMMWCDWNTMGIFGWTTMILLWGGLVALAAWAIRSVGSTNRDRSSDALGILERRFAAGEIDRDEFEQRRRLLEDSRGSRR